MLDVDVEGLLDCLHAHQLMGAGKDLDDTQRRRTGLVPRRRRPDSPTVNNYGVRVSNGAELDVLAGGRAGDARA